MYTKERRVIRMDFGTWSPSHTILVLVVLVAFIGQVAVYFYRTAQNDKKIERLEELMDKRFEQMDKRFVEVISTINQQISVVRSEISVMRSELSDVRGEIRDVRLEMSKLNQNHIDHLTHHHDS